MKVSAIITGAAVLAQTASAHYIFQKINGGAAYTYFRTNTNYNSPVSVGDTTLRCNVGAATGGSTQTFTIAAGSSLTVGADTAVYHNGPILFYLGRVPSGQTASSWDGSGANWFKFEQRGPSSSNQWPLSETYQVQIPSSVPAGTYLLRVEQIGLHNPGGDPQFYVGCAQLQITGGGSCSPSYFSIPGHISASDPGITVNIYNNFSPANYKFPGPGLSCNGGSSNPQPTTTAVRTTTTPAGQTTLRTTTTSARTTTTTGGGSTGGAPLYGQCGGIGWTGPTSCSSGRCVANGSYYSQCVP